MRAKALARSRQRARDKRLFMATQTVSTAGNIGKITQVIGSTLDAQFAEEQLPSLYNALKVEVERTVLGETSRETLWCEVAQHLGGGRVRAVALGSTDGLQRGASIVDTGSAVKVPVGEVTLGR